VFGFPRIQSTGLEPLYYANFLLIPFFIFAADFLKGNKERKFLLIAIATQVALSVSRGAYAGAILGLAILLVLGVKAKVKWQQFAGLGAMLILSVVLALFMTTLEFKNDKNTGTSGEKKTDAIVAQATNFDTQDDRDRNRSLAVQAFSSAPIFGIGPGGFDQYAREQAPIYVGTPGRIIVNNEPLELLAEGGILAFASLAVTMLWIVWQAVSAAWRGKGVPGAWPWLAGLVCYLAALVVQYQTFSTLYIMHVWVVIGILIGVTKLSSGKSVAGKRRAAKKLARSSSRK
jgi:O-antigen ligase